MKHYLQLTESECGLACIATLMAHHRRGPTLNALRRTHEVGRDGMRLREVVAVLREEGYRARAFRVTGTAFDQVPTPWVAHWERAHYLVVRDVGRSHVSVLDPAAGAYRMTREAFAAGFSGFAVVADPDPERPPARAERESPWRVLLPFVQRSAGRLLVLVVAAAVVFGMSLLTPQVVQRVVDGTVTGQAPGNGQALLWPLVATAAGYLVATLVSALMAVSTAVHLGRTIENTVFIRLLHLPYRYFGQRAAGDLLNRLSNAKQLRTLIASDLISGAVSLLLIVVLSVYMATLSPALWLLATGLFAVAASTLIATRGPLDRAAGHELEYTGRGNGIQIDAVATASAIKSSGAEHEYERAWVSTNAATLSWVRRRSVIEAVVSSVLGFIQVFGPILLTLSALTGTVSTDMSLGEVLGFQVVATTFFAQVSTVFAFALRVVETTVVLARIEDILDQEPDTTFAGGTREEVGADVELRGVTFSYTARSQPVLRDVSLRIPAGAKVAVVGASGSGKSTLAKILAGLYQPTSGDVRYGGHPLGAHVRTAFYSAVCYVEQDAPLQNKSIRDNILWTQEDRTDADVVAAAEHAQLHAEVSAMALGYDTMITQLGANVSGGQRQRIVLARALARRPRVLILDEATSALDQRNEAAVFAHLANSAMTRIVVAHRLVTVADADLIVVLADGRVVESGTHAELMRADGTYRALYAASGAATTDVPTPEHPDHRGVRVHG